MRIDGRHSSHVSDGLPDALSRTQYIKYMTLTDEIHDSHQTVSHYVFFLAKIVFLYVFFMGVDD